MSDQPIVLPPDGGRAYEIGAMRGVFKADGPETGDRYCASEWFVEPRQTGPGAHSHVGGVRWWNVRHPSAYTDRLDADTSPAQAREVLTDEDRRVERVLLEVRLRSGLPLTLLRAAGLDASRRQVEDGLLEVGPHREGRAVLTLRGRLLADAVVRDLVD